MKKMDKKMGGKMGGKMSKKTDGGMMRGGSIGESGKSKTVGSFGVEKNEMQANPSLDPTLQGKPLGHSGFLTFGSPDYSLKSLVD